MEFDAFTIVAQLLNFALILFVLKRFLYRPILGAMDEREAVINERLDEAETLKEKADAKAKEFDAKIDEFEAERDERMAKAREDAEAEYQRLHRDLRERAEQLEADWRESMKREARTLLETYRETLGAELLATVRAALDDLATRDLEHQLVDHFIELIGELDDDEVEQRLKAQSGKLRVLTAHRLEASERERLEQALTDRFGDTGVSFDTAPGLIAGIELRFAGHRLGWSIDDYLETLEGRMKRKLQDADHRDAIEAHIDEAWEARDAGSAAS